MKILWVTFIFFLFPGFAFCQSAYRGGSGDGFASDEVNYVTTGMNTSEVEVPFKVFPNPVFKDQINITFTKSMGNSSYELLNQTGQLVSSGIVNHLQSDFLQFHVGPGLYQLVIKTGDAIYRESILALDDSQN